MTDPLSNLDISNAGSHVPSCYFSEIKEGEELEKPIEFDIWKVLCIFQRKEAKFQGAKFERCGNEPETKEKVDFTKGSNKVGNEYFVTNKKTNLRQRESNKKEKKLCNGVI